jgi:hypothetical protein
MPSVEELLQSVGRPTAINEPIKKVNTPEVITPSVTTPEVQTPTADIPADFDVTTFNNFTKTFGREFKDVNDAKEFFGIENKYKEIEGTHALTKKELDDLKAEHERIKKEYNEVGKYVDPKSFFRDEASFRANQLALKYPDKDPNIMEKISRMDIDKTSPIDLIIHNERLQNPEGCEGVSNDDILKYLSKKQYNDDDLNDPESWDTSTKIDFPKRVKEIKNEFKTLQAVELPKTIDIEARKAELLAEQDKKIEISKQGLKNFSGLLISKNPDIKIYDPENPKVELYNYKPKVTDSVVSGLDQFIDTLARNGKDLSSDETAGEIARYREMLLVYENLPEIAKGLKYKVSTEDTNALHDIIHNDKPLTNQIPPKPAVTNSKAAELRSFINNQ